MKKVMKLWMVSICLIVIACDGTPINSPYKKKQVESNQYFTTFSERPKTLDPAKAYSSSEYVFIAQIHDTPLQYHYLKRPYQLIPLALKKMPAITYLDKQFKPTSKLQASYTRYTLTIKPEQYYAPHPAFARNKYGRFTYHNLTNADDYLTLADFKEKGTRELTADDFVYQIKRLADPALGSPIYSVMQHYILDLDKLSVKLKLARKYKKTKIDLNQFNFAGASALSKYQYQITIKKQYPQFVYWLTMPFFTATPWEVDQFYDQAVLKENNINFDWYPVGTGAYQLTENNPNRQMTLKRNPYNKGETYPTEGEAGDKAKGLLALAGKPLPFIDQVNYILEKESIPRWAKFILGYYDRSGVNSDSFDQAVRIQTNGNALLTDQLVDKKIKLNTTVAPTVYYLGFNMLNKKVGRYGKKQRYLRRSISLAIDMNEFISIFMNGQGLVAHSPIPPGIFGEAKSFNPYIFRKDESGQVVRQSLKKAKHYLRLAGYPNGIDPKTGKRLVIHFDAMGSQGPDDKARFNWYRKQFRKLNIDLNIRASQGNRFQQKLANGTAELFFMGWNADYPDPENFLFLFYGPNSKVKAHGENAVNYQNERYDRLFEKMQYMDNTPERLAIIQEMVKILQRDTPWILGFYPKRFLLSHHWLAPIKLNGISNNILKYQKIYPAERLSSQLQWNKIMLWPLAILVLISLIMVWIIKSALKRKELTDESISN